MPDYNFDYKGTLDLDFETFPEVSSPQWMIEEGLAEEGDVSNIITQLEGSDDTGWYLFPTLIGGEELLEKYQGDDIIEFLDRNLGGKHFGKFDSYEEGMEEDALIHEYFESLKESLPVEDQIMNYLKGEANVGIFK